MQRSRYFAPKDNEKTVIRKETLPRNDEIYSVCRFSTVGGTRNQGEGKERDMIGIRGKEAISGIIYDLVRRKKKRKKGRLRVRSIELCSILHTASIHQIYALCAA
jgi:hypothetical protein